MPIKSNKARPTPSPWLPKPTKGWLVLMFKIALPVLRLPWFIKKYQQNKPTIRPLTVGERQLAASVFGELMDYEQVRIVNYPYLPWQPADVLIAPNGFIFVNDKHYQDDYSQHSQRYGRLFIHEMTHVFQHQQGICVLLKGAWLQSLYYLSFCRYDPYHYTWDNNKSFWAYNIEQQGRICEDIYLGKIPNIVCPRPH